MFLRFIYIYIYILRAGYQLLIIYQITSKLSDIYPFYHVQFFQKRILQQCWTVKFIFSIYLELRTIAYYNALKSSF